MEILNNISQLWYLPDGAVRLWKYCIILGRVRRATVSKSHGVHQSLHVLLAAIDTVYELIWRTIGPYQFSVVAEVCDWSASVCVYRTSARHWRLRTAAGERSCIAARRRTRARMTLALNLAMGRRGVPPAAGEGTQCTGSCTAPPPQRVL